MSINNSINLNDTFNIYSGIKVILLENIQIGIRSFKFFKILNLFVIRMCISKIIEQIILRNG